MATRWRGSPSPSIDSPGSRSEPRRLKRRQKATRGPGTSKKARRPGVQICRLWAGLGERCLLRRLAAESNASETHRKLAGILEIGASGIAGHCLRGGLAGSNLQGVSDPDGGSSGSDHQQEGYKNYGLQIHYTVHFITTTKVLSPAGWESPAVATG